MLHFGIFGTHIWVAVTNISHNKFERFLASVEYNTTIGIRRQACKPFQPTIKTGLKLCTRRHGYLYSANRIQWLHNAGNRYLSAQAVVQALRELPPKALRYSLSGVQTHYYFRCLKLFEGVFYTVGYVGSDAHLRYHRHIGRRCLLL